MQKFRHYSSGKGAELNTSLAKVVVGGQDGLSRQLFLQTWTNDCQKTPLCTICLKILHKQFFFNNTLVCILRHCCHCCHAGFQYTVWLQPHFTFDCKSTSHFHVFLVRRGTVQARNFYFSCFFKLSFFMALKTFTFHCFSNSSLFIGSQTLTFHWF